MEFTSTEAKIVNRGRGPEIAGTRITVFDVMDYLKHDWHRYRIASLFRLSSRDIQVAINYIAENREEVEADYQRILDRHANYHYPPEIQTKIDEGHRKFVKFVKQLRGGSTLGERDAQDIG